MITCDDCNGMCCRKLAVHIDTPKTKDDFEDIKWYLYHEGISVYIDNEDDWLVMFPSKCRHLAKDGRCAIYDNRPPVCREAEVSECERNIKEIKHLFSEPEDLNNYLKKRKRS
ncbi:hypothetical protein GF345_06185 [Candidatus Woesearchaeota archaeon]|nr:hypothetical protein [Candidatus Woesearchaeota archaeon]